MRVTVQQCEHYTHMAAPHIHTRPLDRYVALDMVATSNSLREGRVKPGVFSRGATSGMMVEVPRCIEEINRPAMRECTEPDHRAEPHRHTRWGADLLSGTLGSPRPRLRGMDVIVDCDGNDVPFAKGEYLTTATSQTVKPQERESSMTITEGTEVTNINQLRELPVGTTLTVTSDPRTVDSDGTMRFGCQVFSLTDLIRGGFSVSVPAIGRAVVEGPATVRAGSTPESRIVEVAGRRFGWADVATYTDTVKVKATPNLDADLIRHLRTDVLYAGEVTLQRAIDAVRKWDAEHPR